MAKDIFLASREGDLEFVKKEVGRKVDLTRRSDAGFTALHYAAMGSNTTDEAVNFEIIKLLVEGGSDLEAAGDGRTALYFLAEFSHSLAPVEYLVEKGANPDVYDKHGNHITVNAMTEEVQAFLAELTGKAIEIEASDEPEPVKLKAAEWKKAKAELSKVFKELNQLGLVALEDVGYTQTEGFEDCAAEFHKRKDPKAVIGFCFYTNQDTDRAKSYGTLPLAIWGAPEGGEPETINVGQAVVTTFERNGFEVAWNGKSAERPQVYLHKFSGAYRA